MSFSYSSKKSQFDDPKNYYPNPQHYVRQNYFNDKQPFFYKLIQKQNKSQLPPKEFKMSFSQAPRFDTKSTDQSPTEQSIGISPRNNSNMKMSDMIQIYQSNKKGVFKSTFKNIKNAIELSPEYGEGLFKIMQQYDQTNKNEALTPGPAEYSPSFSMVQRKVQSQTIQPAPKFINDQKKLSHNNSSSVQILVENKAPKIGLLPKIEQDRLKETKAYQIRQPKQGVLRKAKIAQNIFDQAKNDEFDPSPNSSSIELFLLRQKQLGPDEVPPPGHYFDSDKFSSFQLKKNSSVNIHFDSTEQRVLTFGNAQKKNGDEDEDDEEEERYERERRQYEESLRKSNFFQSDDNKINTIEDQMEQGQSNTLQSTQSNAKYRSDKFNQSLRNKSSSYTSFYLTKKNPSFGKSLRDSFFDTFKNQYPGPGAYSIDMNQKHKKIENKPNIYYKPSFGSGSIRFLNLKLASS